MIGNMEMMLDCNLYVEDSQPQSELDSEAISTIEGRHVKPVRLTASRKRLLDIAFIYRWVAWRTERAFQAKFCFFSQCLLVIEADGLGCISMSRSRDFIPVHPVELVSPALPLSTLLTLLNSIDCHVTILIRLFGLHLRLSGKH